MKKQWVKVLEIVALFAMCCTWICLNSWFSRCTHDTSKGVKSRFLAPNGVYRSPLLDADAGKEDDDIPKENPITRTFKWADHAKINRETVFHIDTEDLKKEIRKFGTSHAVSHPLALKAKGFLVVGRKDYFENEQLRENMISMIDYRQIFQRNLSYFKKKLTAELMKSEGISQVGEVLYPFLCFIQHIRYEIPPRLYKGKFINAFFVPLVLLYEQYGDCDSKAILLADFLCSIPGFKEKTALVLIRGRSLSHAILAVKGIPRPGMTALHDMKKGYYLVMETTSPGWGPGFVSRRVTDALKDGFFHFVELN